MRRAEFWYEFASTCSYPAAMRVENCAAARGVSLVWRPFLLGPIFVAQGWRDSPFNIYPVKGRYMWRDLERVCRAEGLALRRPQTFPQNTLAAARIALVLSDADRPRFTRAVYLKQFGEGGSIAEPETLADLLRSLGHDAASTMIASGGDTVKAELRTQCERAVVMGLPGAPCLTTEDGEVFWGNDRLEQGLDWAAGVKPGF